MPKWPERNYIKLLKHNTTQEAARWTVHLKKTCTKLIKG